LLGKTTIIPREEKLPHISLNPETANMSGKIFLDSNNHYGRVLSDQDEEIKEEDEESGEYM